MTKAVATLVATVLVAAGPNTAAPAESGDTWTTVAPLLIERYGNARAERFRLEQY